MEQQQCLDGLEDERTIFRHPKDREHPYVMVAKATVMDTRVSPAARCLLVVMLCMPDDWDFNIRHLAGKFGANKDTIAVLLRELLEAGYVVRQQTRRKGRFSCARYMVFEHPTVSGNTVSEDTGHGGTVSGETVSGAFGHTDTPDPETEDGEETDTACAREASAGQGPPSPEAKPSDDHLPSHMQLATAWYRRLAKKTGKLIAPAGEDYLAAQKACERTTLETLMAVIDPYFAGEFWFTRDRTRKKATYSFGSFLAHFPEILAAAPANGPGPPRKERLCPACNQVLVFGTGRFTRCRCGKAWEIDDAGELQEVNREVVGT